MSVSHRSRLEDQVRARLGPSSLSWRYVGDARNLLLGGRALLLQVAHPVVGAGVSEHSNFRADPWGRLQRTIDNTITVVYGTPDESVAQGRWLHRRHAAINGALPDGGRYHALDPEAYFWVHATLLDTVVVSHALLGRPIPEPDIPRFYEESKTVAAVLGVPSREVPDDWPSFRDRFDEIVRTRLDDNDAVREVWTTLGDLTPPPWFPSHAAWAPLRLGGGTLARLVTAGTLSPAVRDRLGIRWTANQQRQLDAVAALTRRAAHRVPFEYRFLPEARRAWQRERQAQTAPA